MGDFRIIPPTLTLPSRGEGREGVILVAAMLLCALCEPSGWVFFGVDERPDE